MSTAHTLADYEAVLDGIAGQRHVVVGDVILDHYIWGDAERISPEAPVPVVDIARDTWVLGGAANVALNLRSVGAACELCGSLGDDASGASIRQLLTEQQIAFDNTFVSADRATITKARVMVRQQQLCRLDREQEPAKYALDAQKVADKLSEARCVIVSDYAKGAVHPAVMEAVLAAQPSIFRAMDPKPKHALEFSGMDLLTPNRSEALLLANMELTRHDAFPEADICQRIYAAYQPKYLVVTLGSAGMLMAEKGQVVGRVPALAREVYDVSGAGDTSIAVLSAALASGADFELAVQLATAAASVVVTKVGTATATREEILDEVRRAFLP